MEISHKDALRKTIDAWNKNEGGSGVSCTTTDGAC